MVSSNERLRNVVLETTYTERKQKDIQGLQTPNKLINRKECRPEYSLLRTYIELSIC